MSNERDDKREIDEIIMRFLGLEVWEEQALLFAERRLPAPPKVPGFAALTIPPPAQKKAAS